MTHKFCPECGTKAPSIAAKFCSSCGSSLSGFAAPKQQAVQQSRSRASVEYDDPDGTDVFSLPDLAKCGAKIIKGRGFDSNPELGSLNIASSFRIGQDGQIIPA